MGLSVCAVTQWLSDTSLTCTQSPSLGSIRSFALTVERSAVGQFNSSFSFLPTQNGIGNCASVSALTAASLVTIVGAGFGVWDSSVRARMTSLSMADATVWLCDTRISTKLLLSVRNSPGVTVSLLRVVSNLSAVSVPVRLVRITACNSSNQGAAATRMDQLTVASSGSNLIFVTGISLGAVSDNSIRVKLSLSSGQYSAWSSDSIVRSKTPWGFRAQTPQLMVSMDLTSGNSSGLFNFMSSDVQHLTIINQSATIMRLNGSNLSPFQLQAVVKIDERAVAINWTSDSSIDCAYPWPVSREAVNFFVRFFDASPLTALLSTTAPANPVFIPSSKPIAESLNVRLYIPVPTDVINNVGGYIQRGPATGWVFPAPQSSGPPSFFQSEIIDIDIAIFNNHTQVYLKDYTPTGVDIVGAIYDATTGLINDHICYGNSSISTKLPPNAFATLFRSSIALCSLPNNLALWVLSIVVHIQVRDELGILSNFYSPPSALSIRARPQAVLPPPQFTNATFYAGIANTAPMTVSLTNAGASCSRLVFDYTANISCLSNQRYVPVSFFPTGFCNQGQGILSLRNTILSTCDINLQALTFGLAGSCRITIDVPSFGASLVVPISILPGDPSDMFVVGQLPSQISEGGIIWSNNASGMKCLELSFLDKCNNSRSAGGFTCKLSAFLSNTSQYALLGQTNIDADSNGRCIFCGARTSLTAPLLVRLQVQWLQLQMHLQPLINVSGLGEAAAVSLNTAALSNVSKAGNVLPPLTFKLFNANGFPLAVGNTVIRLRIVRKGSVR
jgi:hypothetical protein